MLIREKVFPSDHPMVATSYNEVAWAYCVLERYAEALLWAEKCVAICPSVPNFIDTLATAYQGLGRLEEAMEQLELSLKLKKEQGRMGGHTEESIKISEAKIAQLKGLMKS
jgi:tetratricopeptide (TPR) repeat protein